MLKFNTGVKKKEFELQLADGSTEKAFFTQFNVADSREISEFTKGLLESIKEGSISDIDGVSELSIKRLQVSVKNESGAYVFEFDELKLLPPEVVSLMGDEVDKLNPWPKADETLEEKKS